MFHTKYWDWIYFNTGKSSFYSKKVDRKTLNGINQDIKTKILVNGTGINLFSAQ